MQTRLGRTLAHQASELWRPCRWLWIPFLVTPSWLSMMPMMPRSLGKPWQPQPQLASVVASWEQRVGPAVAQLPQPSPLAQLGPVRLERTRPHPSAEFWVPLRVLSPLLECSMASQEQTRWLSCLKSSWKVLKLDSKDSPQTACFVFECHFLLSPFPWTLSSHGRPTHLLFESGSTHSLSNW